MTEPKKENSFLGGAGQAGDGGSLFASVSGQAHKEAAPPDVQAAARGRVDELERRLRLLEEERTREKARHGNEEPKKGPDPLEFLKARVLELEKEIGASREREGDWRAECEKVLRLRLDALDGLSRQFSAALRSTEGKIAAVEALCEETRPLPARLNLVEKELLPSLVGRLRETWQKIASLTPEFARFLAFENRLSKMELKADEIRDAFSGAGACQAALEERMASTEHKSEEAALELRSAWDMIDLLVARVDGWDKKFGEILAEFRGIPDERRRREEEFRDTVSKTTNMWGRFTFVEKELAEMRGKAAAADAERRESEAARARLAAVEKELREIRERIKEKRETITQMKTQIQDMNSLLGKIGA